MRRVLAASCIAAACCGGRTSSTPQAPQRSPTCDATGVWRIDLGDDEIIEATVDPALVRVELPEEALGADSGLAVALDVSRCRLHVVRRSTQRYEEGYGNTDSTLRLEIPLGPGRRPVTGTYRVVTLDPPGEESFEVEGTAERRGAWTP